ncbi:MAG TPA: MFS transporter [Candidatus Saccharimonadales bacterium]|nr:MFS transporter [Candidatus Saccharimonadales bacterium]
MNTQTEKVQFPPGLNNAYFFATFNALSFQMVLGSPMLLYAKSIGASATVLGIIAGMMPLLVIFQIPAAQHVARVGYKKFVYAGWGTRVMFIFVLAGLPITFPILNETSRLALLLLLLFGFNLSRGISSAGWLPWITSLVPAPIRGGYLARDAAWVSMASFCSFILASFCLQANPRPWQFSLLFLFSALMGATSLVFLKRIPEGVSDEDESNSKAPVPWGAIFRYKPFQKLLWMAMSWAVAYGGLTAFTVVYLKTEAGLSEGHILLLNSVFFLGGLCSLILGSRLDRLGSKPVLTFAFLAWLLIIAGWTLLAGRFLNLTLSLILCLQFVMGLCASLVSMSNTRLAMAIAPPMGKNHFFALFSVSSNVTLGLAPILWGVMIDAVGPAQIQSLGVEWNRYSLFFLCSGATLLGALGFCLRLHEPEAASLEQLLHELLIQSPHRVWVRLWLRE